MVWNLLEKRIIMENSENVTEPTPLRPQTNGFQ